MTLLPYHKFLEILARPNKEYGQIRLTNTITPPVLYSEHEDSFAIQLLRNEYVYFLQDGDVLVNQPISPDRRVWTVGMMNDLICSDHDKAIIQYKKGAGLIHLGELPNLDNHKIILPSHSLVNAMREVLNIATNSNTPVQYLSIPDVHPKTTCFGVLKSKDNWLSYLEQLHERPNIKESLLLTGSDIKLLSGEPPVLNKVVSKVEGELENKDILWRHLYHPDYGFTFIGSIMDLITPEYSTHLNFGVGIFTIEVKINAEKKTATSNLLIDIDQLDFPERLSKLFRGKDDQVRK